MCSSVLRLSGRRFFGGKGIAPLPAISAWPCLIIIMIHAANGWHDVDINT